jgi:hypothetical protein
VRAQRGEYSTNADSPNIDVLIAVAAERMRMGQRMDLGAKVELMQNFHRNFSEHTPNLNLQLTARLKRW